MKKLLALLFLPSLLYGANASVNVSGVYPPYATVLQVPTAQATLLPSTSSVGSYPATLWPSSLIPTPYAGGTNPFVTNFTVVGASVNSTAITVQYPTFNAHSFPIVKKYTWSIIYPIGLNTLTPTYTPTNTFTFSPTVTGTLPTATFTPTVTPTYTPYIQAGKVTLTNGVAYVNGISFVAGDAIVLTCHNCTGQLSYNISKPTAFEILDTNRFESSVIDWAIIRTNPYTQTFTPTVTNTSTTTPTATPTWTATPTNTLIATSTRTPTPVADPTPTVTLTPVFSWTPSPTPTVTPIF